MCNILIHTCDMTHCQYTFIFVTWLIHMHSYVWYEVFCIFCHPTHTFSMPAFHTLYTPSPCLPEIEQIIWHHHMNYSVFSDTLRTPSPCLLEIEQITWRYYMKCSVFTDTLHTPSPQKLSRLHDIIIWMKYAVFTDTLLTPSPCLLDIEQIIWQFYINYTVFTDTLHVPSPCLLDIE